MADGKIRIDTVIDNSNAQADLGQLEGMCERTAQNVQKTTARIFDAKGKPIKLIDVNSEASLKKAQARISDLKGQIEQVEASTDRMLEGAATDEQAVAVLELEKTQLQGIRDEYDELTRRVAEYEQAKQQAMTAGLENAGIADASRTAKLEAEATAYVNNIKNADEYNRKLSEIEVKLEAIRAASLRAAAEKGVDVNAVLSANTEYGKLEARYNALIDAADKFKDKSSNSFGFAAKACDKVENSIKRGIKQIAKYTLAMFGFRSVFMGIKSLMNTFISNNEDLSNSISGIKGALSEMLGPAITYIIGLAKTAMAYINAFVTALSGIDFVARWNAKALEKQTKATNGLTAAQRQNQSASFDEQTKLSSQSSSSSGGSSSSGTLDLDPISDEAMEKIQKFADGLKSVWEWVCKNKEIVIILGSAIATAFAVAKIAGFIGKLSELSGILSGSVFGGLILLAGGITAVILGIKDMVKNGLNWKNILTVLAGAIAATIGVILIFNSSLLASPITWIIIGIEALIAVIALCIVYWDDIKEAAKKSLEWIKEKWGEFAEWLKSNVTEPTKQFFVNIWEKIKEIFCNIKQWFSEKFTDAKDGIIYSWGNVKGFFYDTWQKIKDIFSNVGVWFKEKFTDAWQKIKDVFGGVGSFFGGIFDTIKSKFSTIGTKVGEAISSSFKAAINAVLKTAETVLNSPIRAINQLLDTINKIPGINLSKLSTFSIPRLARGGIVNNPGRGVPVIAGEAGSEAILPLDQNTEWMDVLAEKIGGGNVTVPIYLDGKLIARNVINIQQKMAFAKGGTI